MTKAITKTEGAAPVAPAPTGTPADLLRLAVEGNADVDKLEKLMELQERWESNQARKAFFGAMGKFQSSCPEVIKRNDVCNKYGVHMYAYASLPDIVRAVRNLEHSCGLMHRFDTEPQEKGGARITCIVSHVDGHSERTTVSIPATKGMNTNCAQDHGIVITYGERYSFLGAFGITTGTEDTDGREPANVEPITVQQLAVLDGLIDQCSPDTGEKLCKWAKVREYAELPASMFTEAIKILNAKIQQGAKQENLPL